MAEAEFVRWSAVVERVGRALFRDEYIPRLTWHEHWLLEATGLLGVHEPMPDDGSVDPFGRRQQPTGPFHSLPEVPAARAKQAFMTWQRERIFEWVQEQGLTVHERDGYDEVEQRAFEAAFRQAFPADGSAEPADPASARRPPSAGRPREWDWDGAYAEIVRIAHTPDGLPDVQARVVEQVAQWFIATQGNHPAESVIKERVSAVYGRLKLGRK